MFKSNVRNLRFYARMHECLYIYMYINAYMRMHTQIWDIRTGESTMSFKGHTDTITGLRLSPHGTLLLSNAMDNTLRVWDTRPYVEGDRCKCVMRGHVHNFEKALLRCVFGCDFVSFVCNIMKHVHNFEKALLRCVFGCDFVSFVFVYYEVCL